MEYYLVSGKSIQKLSFHLFVIAFTCFCVSTLHLLLWDWQWHLDLKGVLRSCLLFGVLDFLRRLLGKKIYILDFSLTGSQNSGRYFWGFGVLEYHFLAKIYICWIFDNSITEHLVLLFGVLIFASTTFWGIYIWKIYILYIPWPDHRT